MESPFQWGVLFCPLPVCDIHPTTTESLTRWCRFFSQMILWQAPVPLCQVLGKFEQQPVLWCQGLWGVRTGIIEQRVADRGSWHWEQTDVAILKKYTTSELNMKSGGGKRGDFVSASWPIAVLSCKLKYQWLVSCCDENQVIHLKNDLRDATETLKKSSRKKTAGRSIL